MNDVVNMTALRRLVKIYNDTEELTKFIKKVVYDYEPKIDELIREKSDEIADEIFGEKRKVSRALFSEETTKKILSHMGDNTALVQNTSKD